MIDETNDTPAPKPAKGHATSGEPVDYANLRGDAVRSLAEFVGENLKPTISGIQDPISGAQALVRIDGAGQVTQIPPSIFDGYLPGPRFRGGAATLLSLDRLFQADREDGTLDALILGPVPMPLVSFVVPPAAPPAPKMLLVKVPVPLTFVVGTRSAACTRYCARACSTLPAAMRRSRLLASAVSITPRSRSSRKKSRQPIAVTSAASLAARG